MGDRLVSRAEDGLAPHRSIAREWGGPEGRPLLFWPGLSPFGDLQLNEVGPLLAERGFRVLSIAAPGMGETPALDSPDDYRPTRLAELVLDVADAHGIDRFVYMGFSWGASLGVHLAAGRPERVEALVLLDAGHLDVELDATREQLEAEFAREQEQYVFDTWDDFFAKVADRVPVWRPALEERYRAALEERDGKLVPCSDPRAAAWALHALTTEPPSSTHTRLTVPVLLILAGRNDTREAAERFQAAVPHAVLRTLDTGHDVIAEAPEETVELVADWLD